MNTRTKKKFPITTVSLGGCCDQKYTRDLPEGFVERLVTKARADGIELFVEDGEAYLRRTGRLTNSALNIDDYSANVASFLCAEHDRGCE